MSGGVRVRRVAAHVALLVAAGLLTGCDDLHASRRAAAIDVCAAALPPGQAAAGPQARLTAVRRVSLQQAQALFGSSAAATPGASATPPDAGAPPGSRLCVLAFQAPGRSDRTPASGSAPPVVLVLTTTQHPRVLATLDVPSLPPQLR